MLLFISLISVLEKLHPVAFILIKISFDATLTLAPTEETAEARREILLLNAIVISSF